MVAIMTTVMRPTRCPTRGHRHSEYKIRREASAVYVHLSFKFRVYMDQLHISHPHRSQSFDVGYIPLD